MVSTEINAKDLVLKIRDRLNTSGWNHRLKDYFISGDFENTIQQLIDIRKDSLHFTPILANSFNWLKMCPEHKVKAVIFLDCSHAYEKGGSGLPLERPNRTMQYILDSAGVGCDSSKWIKQGVLMMPLALTRVIDGEPCYEVWRNFIGYMVNRINEDHENAPIVFIGKKTHKYIPVFKTPNKKVLNIYPEFDHTCKWSDWVNEVLMSNGSKGIKWS